MVAVIKTTPWADFGPLIRSSRASNGLSRIDLNDAAWPEANRLSYRRIRRLEDEGSQPDLEECAALGIELGIAITGMADASGYSAHELAVAYDIAARSRLQRALLVASDNFTDTVNAIAEVDANRAASLEQLSDDLDHLYHRVFADLDVS
jgi:hypothetical protein